jgi:hypothetical protein
MITHPQRIMPQNQLTSFITTASGFAGGMTKALMGIVALKIIACGALVEKTLYSAMPLQVHYFL